MQIIKGRYIFCLTFFVIHLNCNSMQPIRDLTKISTPVQTVAYLDYGPYAYHTDMDDLIGMYPKFCRSIRNAIIVCGVSFLTYYLLVAKNSECL